MADFGGNRSRQATTLRPLRKNVFYLAYKLLQNKLTECYNHILSNEVIYVVVDSYCDIKFIIYDLSKIPNLSIHLSSYLFFFEDLFFVHFTHKLSEADLEFDTLLVREVDLERNYY